MESRDLVAITSTVILGISLVLIPFTCGLQFDLNGDLNGFPNPVPFVILFVFGLFCLSLWSIGASESGSLDPPLPYTWFIATAFANLVEVILLPQLVYLVTGMWIGLFILLPWLFTLLTPYMVYVFAREGLIRETHMGKADAEILAIARKYGGILAQSVVVWETNVPLEEAKKRLERFCKYGEAIKKKVGSLTVYDFPSARTYLSRTDSQIIELLRDNPYGMSRAQLLQITGLSIESLDEALKRLETKGIIYYDVENEIYKLMGIAPITKNNGATK